MNTGSIVTDPHSCVCDHSPDEHGRDPAYPEWTGCRAEVDGLRPGERTTCRCPVYECCVENASSGSRTP